MVEFVSEPDREPEPEAPRPVKVPAARGASWLQEGLSLFKQHPGPWVGAILVWMLLMFALNVVPILGPMAAYLLNPLIVGGLMLGCAQAARGGDFKFEHLFAGFSHAKKGDLFLLGAIYLGLLIVIFIIFAIMLLITLGLSGLSGAPTPEQVAASPALWLSVLVLLALAIPVAMAFWFAPALVVLNHSSAMDALTLSFKACLKNWLAFLVYGLVLLVASFVIGFLLALLMGIGGSVGGEAGVAATSMLVLLPMLALAVIVQPIIFGSIFAGYRDIFAVSEPETGSEATSDSDLFV